MSLTKRLLERIERLERELEDQEPAMEVEYAPWLREMMEARRKAQPAKPAPGEPAAWEAAPR